MTRTVTPAADRLEDLPDPLAPLLPSAADADRPWLVWYAPGERVELTGHVLSMWQCKIANLLTTEAHTDDPAAGPLVHLDLGVHWRALTWCGGAWLVGGAVAFTEPAAHAGSSPSPGGVLRPADVSVAFEPAGLSADAQVQVLVPREPLATRWPGTLPPLVLDGVADVMPHADSFPAHAVGGATTAMVHYPAQAPGTAVEVSRDALVADLTPPLLVTPGGTGAGGTDRAGGEDRTHAALLGGNGRTGGGARAGTRAVLVRAGAAQEAVRGVLAAWQAGLTAVLISPDADEALVRDAARQEGAEAGKPRR
ncbi:TIGR03089 family protein [Actinomyces sp. 432]|uniref:TIGR03089 family protein n=1 Tax=Actinomyces sp. 432 TaxID=2057798 RepID=UPI001F460F56|nr:TIGR03089 family protein [Actinomyces sp. 432]